MTTANELMLVDGAQVSAPIASGAKMQRVCDWPEAARGKIPLPAVRATDLTRHMIGRVFRQSQRTPLNRRVDFRRELALTHLW
jgi:hypothetical protein